MANWSVGGFTGPRQPADDDLAGVVRLEYSPTPDPQSGTRVAIAASLAGGRDGAIGVGEFGRDFRGDGVMLATDARIEMNRLLVATEIISASWDAVGGIESDAAGLYITAGWMSSRRTQILARWDRYRATGGENDDQAVIGFNVWPTSASEVQVNWLAPVAGSDTPHKLLVNFQIGF